MAKDGVVATGKKSNTSFTLTPEQSWAPSVTLIVYLLNSDCPHNISKTSRKISIKGSFENKVNLFWSKSKLQPGENSSLSVNVGETHSLVGLRVIEKTVKKNENDLTANRVSLSLAVSRPFFISVNLPFSVTRGEQFILEVTVYNYKAGQIVAMVTLEASDAFEVITNNDVGTVAGQIKVTVPMEDKETVLFPIRTKKLGKIPIKVKATSSSEESDAVSKTIYVKAEGVKHFYSEAAVFQVSGGGTVSKTFSFSFPSDVVHDSEEAFVTVVGDILGPSIDGLESLIQMPYGCGEQNMINFAPNIYVLQYLIATKQIKEEIKKRAISYMEDGYQRELTYKRSDGSFSAFGNSDDSGSTWLSAFVFRCFLQAREFIFISKEVLDKTVQWLVQYQDVNTGIFSEPGRVIHTELQGGLNGPITLTAYILTSLLEDEIYKVIDKAMKYLESKFTEGISSNYTLSVVVYALSLANSSKASIALDQLNSRADKTGDVMYWSSPSVTTYYWQPQSTDIETAAYALLSHRVQKRILEGIPIMKWLSQQRSQLGGYSSTQDTIMALQALSQFLIVNPSDDTSLTLTVTGPGSPVSISFKINSENLLLLQSQQITVSQPLSITVSASGRGIAIFQLNINYNQKASSRRRRSALIPEAFLLDVTVIDDEADIQRLSKSLQYLSLHYSGSTSDTECTHTSSLTHMYHTKIKQIFVCCSIRYLGKFWLARMTPAYTFSGQTIRVIQRAPNCLRKVTER
uniref:Alpha-2-macroglobulin domain-containing protein n=1 Tax=Leptobrachium leishanense TaxID=445787 RepID=A0A8C5MP20_9ANUR